MLRDCLKVRFVDLEATNLKASLECNSKPYPEILGKRYCGSVPAAMIERLAFEQGITFRAVDDMPSMLEGVLNRGACDKILRAI